MGGKRRCFFLKIILAKTAIWGLLLIERQKRQRDALTD